MRGFRTARDLADAIDSPNISESVIENIEAGRKADLPVSQLLNIAFALQAPPSYLLVPLDAFPDHLDLPGLSEQLRSMTPFEFDSWLSGLANGPFRSPTAAEQAARTELDAARELHSLRLEQNRLQVAVDLESLSPDGHKSAAPLGRPTGDSRRADIQKQIDQLVTYLRSAGWEMSD